MLKKIQKILFCYWILCLIVSCTNKEKTSSGLEYIHHSKGNGRKVEVGTIAIIRYAMKNEKGDTVLSTYQTGTEVEQPVLPSPYPGSLMEGLAMLSEGDSATFFLDTDKIVGAGGNLHYGVHKGSQVAYTVKVVKLKEYEDNGGGAGGFSQAYLDSLSAEGQRISGFLNGKPFQSYLKSNGFKVSADSLNSVYYVVEKKGDGEKLVDGDSVVFNYEGKLIDGTVFDNNQGKPSGFILGKTQVIKGWDIAFRNYVKEGSKVLVVVPSTYAFANKGAAIGKANPQTGKIDKVVIAPYTPIIFIFEVHKVFRKVQ
jgi:FKBP-type peptidyl-prolyl cis-trans isomerase FkpA